MQTTETYLGLLHERGKRGLPLKRVYRQLFNRNLYLSAYGKIYRNAGALTPGVTEDTADTMSLDKIERIIAAVRTERYQWQPARRTDIPKKNGKQRPLGLPVWSDKLLAEVIRMILDAYYDVQFSDHSHGFRTGRGCHTALRDIYHNWGGTTWIIEGDIADCFGSLSHTQLLSARSQENPRRALSPSREQTPGGRIPGGLEISPDAQWRPARLDSQPNSQQHSAGPIRYVRRNGPDPPLHQGCQKKTQPRLPTTVEPSAQALQERADGGCSTPEKTGSAPSSIRHL
jgi:Reverse transcriptase (RNA-dependent DNA polymerase)